MALSTFKSTTKRGTNTNGPNSSKKDNKAPNLRSRSLSAVSRANGSSSSSSNLSVSDEFLNKRDNPLYCCSGSSSSPSPGSEALSGDLLEGSRRRGRSVSRSLEVGEKSSGSNRNEKTARSLSRVDMGRMRMRSVSREHYGNLETEVQHRLNSTTSLRSNEVGKISTSKGQRKSALSDTEFDAKEKAKKLQTWTSRHPISGSWDASSSRSQAQNWEDGISTSSFSEAEETLASETFQRDNPPIDVGSGAIYETVRSEVRRAVSEIRDDLENAIWGKQPIFTTENVGDISPDFVDTDELGTHMRSEYISRLEQAQERARKLRADLAIEEQRERELSRILDEIIHDPRNSDRKSHPKRKTSIERRRMSRRLAEEAMNYFDECVSISTFDSSDFSSLEDPQSNSITGVPTATMVSSRFSSNEGSKNHHEELDNQTRCSYSIQESDLALSSSSSSNAGSLIHANVRHDDLITCGMPQSENIRQSFAQDQTKTVEVHDIRSYVQKFGKGPRIEILEHVNVKSSYSEEYDLGAKSESLVFDHLIFRNRIKSGGLVLCNLRIF